MEAVIFEKLEKVQVARGVRAIKKASKELLELLELAEATGDPRLTELADQLRQILPTYLPKYRTKLVYARA